MPETPLEAGVIRLASPEVTQRLGHHQLQPRFSAWARERASSTTLTDRVVKAARDGILRGGEWRPRRLIWNLFAFFPPAGRFPLPCLFPEGHCTCFGYLPLASHQPKVMAMQLVFRRMIVQVDARVTCLSAVGCVGLGSTPRQASCGGGRGCNQFLAPPPSSPPRQQIYHTATGNCIDLQREPDLLSYTSRVSRHPRQPLPPISDTLLWPCSHVLPSLIEPNQKQSVIVACFDGCDGFMHELASMRAIGQGVWKTHSRGIGTGTCTVELKAQPKYENPAYSRFEKQGSSELISRVS